MAFNNFLLSKYWDARSMFILLPFGGFQNEPNSNLLSLMNKSVIYNIVIIIRNPEMNITSIFIYDPKKSPSILLIPVTETTIENIFPNKRMDLN